MSDVFLGVIAAAVLVMAIIQVTAIVFAIRAARRVGDAVGRLEQEVKPIMANVQAVSSEAARAAGVAAAQVDRLEGVVGEISKRVDETAAAVQSTIVGPAREGYALFQGLLAALAAVRRQGGGPSRRRPAAAEEEDPLFIG